MKIGDRVGVKDPSRWGALDKNKGTIIYIEDTNIYIRFDENVGGWSLTREDCPHGHGWIIGCEDVFLLNKPHECIGLILCKKCLKNVRKIL